jgi:hypothetical protein
MLGIHATNGIYTCQAPKENSPTSGLLKFLVARGGIEPGPRMADSISRLSLQSKKCMALKMIFSLYTLQYLPMLFFLNKVIYEKSLYIHPAKFFINAFIFKCRSPIPGEND